MSLIPIHVAGGAIGILSGLVALYALKGLPLHRKSGMVFAVAMLMMSISGVAIAFGRPGAVLNVPSGLVTAYLVVTSLATVRPRSAQVQRVEAGAMWFAFLVGAGSVVAAVVSGARGKGGFAFPLLMFGAIALGAARGDSRMIRGRGLQGRERIRRHLWRMSTALAIAAGAFFLGPVRRVPEPLRLPALKLIPLLVLVTMAYWLWRYRRRRQSPEGVVIGTPEAI